MLKPKEKTLVLHGVYRCGIYNKIKQLNNFKKHGRRNINNRGNTTAL